MTEDIYEENKRHRYDMEMNFLSRWSILAGGTFSLLIPLLQSLRTSLVSKGTLITGGILLISSLICSLLGMFFLKEYVRNYNFLFKIFRIKESNMSTSFFIAKEIASIVAMITYILGVIFIALFIKANLL